MLFTVPSKLLFPPENLPKWKKKKMKKGTLPIFCPSIIILTPSLQDVVIKRKKEEKEERGKKGNKTMVSGLCRGNPT